MPILEHQHVERAFVALLDASDKLPVCLVSREHHRPPFEDGNVGRWTARMDLPLTSAGQWGRNYKGSPVG
jgi:hypothetical protein